MQTKSSRFYRGFAEHLERRDLLSVNSFELNTNSTASGNPREYVIAGEQAFYISNSSDGAQLWATNGTSDGTKLVNAGIATNSLVPFGNRVIFPNGGYRISDGETTELVASATNLEAVSPEAALFTSSRALIIAQADGSIVQLDGPTDLWRSGQAVGVLPDSFLVTGRSELYQVWHDGSFQIIGDTWGQRASATYTPTEDGIFLTNFRSQVFYDFETETVSELFEDTNFGLRMQGEPINSGPSNIFIWATDERNSNALTLVKTDGTQLGTLEVGSFAQQDDIYSVVDDKGGIYFRALTLDNKVELWHSDGTVEGTRLIKELVAGPEIGYVRNMTVANDEVWFIANDFANGEQIWRTDPTDFSTAVATDIPTSSSLQILGWNDDEVFFTAWTPETGAEIWASSGTPDSTRLVADVFAGPASSSPSEFTEMANGKYLFAATSPMGRETWVYDAQTDETSLLMDTFESQQTLGSSPNEFVQFQDNLFFVASDGRHGTELWKTDGVQQPTLLKDIRPGELGSGVSSLTVVDEQLYFVADDGEHGFELWQSDGTEAGTKLAGDIVPGIAGAIPTGLTAIGESVYFAARLNDTRLDTPSSLGISLFPEDVRFATGIWKHDGTELTKVYEPQDESSVVFGFTASSDRGIFYEYDLEQDVASLKTIEVAQGTDVISQLEPEFGSRQVTKTEVRNGNLLFFIADVEDFCTRCNEVWIWKADEANPTSLTAEQTENQQWNDIQLFDGWAVLTRSNRKYLSDLSDNLLSIGTRNFAYLGQVDETTIAFEAANQRVLLAGDGIDSLRSTKAFSELGDEFVMFDDSLHFTARETENSEWELYRTDGTEAGTVRLTNGPKGLGLRPQSLAAIGDRLYFSGHDGQSGRELHWIQAGEAFIGDASEDGTLDENDIDAFYALIESGNGSSRDDLNRDGQVDNLDANYLATSMLDFKKGDANFDGSVDFNDFLLLSMWFGQEGGTWGRGDFNGDGEINFIDFLTLSTNFQ